MQLLPIANAVSKQARGLPPAPVEPGPPLAVNRTEGWGRGREGPPMGPQRGWGRGGALPSIAAQSGEAGLASQGRVELSLRKRLRGQPLDNSCLLSVPDSS